VAYNFLENSSSMERTNVDVFLAGIEKAFRYPLDIYNYIYVIQGGIGKSAGNQMTTKTFKSN